MPKISSTYLYTTFNLLLIIVVVYLGIDSFYDLLLSRTAVVQPAASDQTANSSGANPLPEANANYQVISQRNLFNTTANKETTPQPSEFDNLDKTKLNLTLWGTITGISDKLYAVIEDGQTAKQQLYREGDRIQNASIRRVLRDKVVLRVNGKDEILEIAKPHMRSSGGRASRPQPSVGGPVRTQRITLQRAQVDAAMKDVNKLMSQVNVKPYYQGGQPDGFIVSRIEPNSIIRRMGLRNGDIITGVNGERIKTMEDAMKFYQNLSSAKDVTVQIRRRGRPRNIQYSIR